MILSRNPPNLPEVAKSGSEGSESSANTESEKYPSQEPRILLCFHCGQVCASAWSLVQHFSQYHSQIYSSTAIPAAQMQTDSASRNQWPQQNLRPSSDLKSEVSETMEYQTSLAKKHRDSKFNLTSSALANKYKVRLQNRMVS